MNVARLFFDSVDQATAYVALIDALRNFDRWYRDETRELLIDGHITQAEADAPWKTHELAMALLAEIENEQLHIPELRSITEKR
jgi:hypothetical protein